MVFSLLWDSHKSYVAETVENMYRSAAFCDCRLFGAGGVSLYCHKLVLSSFSPILKNVIKDCPGPDPVSVTLAEVSSAELAALVDFMYTGEASFPAETMPGFLDLCQMLKVPSFQLQLVESCLPFDAPKNEHIVELGADVENLPTTDDWIEANDDDVAMFYANDAYFIKDEIEENEGGESTMLLLDEPKVKKKKSFGDKPVQIKKKYKSVALTPQPKNELNLDDIRDLGENHPKRYQCKKCGNKYSHKRTITHHLCWICGQPPTHACEFCNYRGKRRFQLKSHLLRFHQISTTKNSVKKKE